MATEEWEEEVATCVRFWLMTPCRLSILCSTTASLMHSLWQSAGEVVIWCYSPRPSCWPTRSWWHWAWQVSACLIGTQRHPCSCARVDSSYWNLCNPSSSWSSPTSPRATGSFCFLFSNTFSRCASSLDFWQQWKCVHKQRPSLRQGSRMSRWSYNWSKQ